jgi:hypothetical protein
VWEWILDYTSAIGCTDCANTTTPWNPPPLPGVPPSTVPLRGSQGGGLGGAPAMAVVTYLLDDTPSTQRTIEQGARCGRAPL